MGFETAAEQAFAAAVPEHLQQEIRERMCEAAHSERAAFQGIHIINRDWLNVINVRVSGTIEIESVEHWFILESGDCAGDVLRAWDEVGEKEFAPYQPTRYVLAPTENIVGEAILAGRGPFLIAKWDAIATRADVAKIPADYAYDRFFQPGGQIEGHYRDAAAKFGFRLVDEEHAAEIRARLATATEPPIIGGGSHG